MFLNIILNPHENVKVLHLFDIELITGASSHLFEFGCLKTYPNQIVASENKFSLHSSFCEI